MNKAYAETLDAVAQLLRDNPMTARDLSTALACSLPVVYARLRALEARGEAIHKRRRGGARGPRPRVYWVDG